MMRSFEGLDDVITVLVIHPLMLEHDWTFAPSKLGVKDDLYGLNYLYELYLKADPNYSGRVTVPVLWDKQEGTIVSNESADIIRMLNTSFKEFEKNATDYYPAKLAAEIDDINDFVYNTMNNRVYKAGFATEQTVYETEAANLFEALEQLEKYWENKTIWLAIAYRSRYSFCNYTRSLRFCLSWTL